MKQYALSLERAAFKQLERLPEDIRVRIADAINALANDPRPFGCKKLAGREAAYRLRVGDYRIVYSVNDRENVVEIIKLGHRREVYRG